MAEPHDWAGDTTARPSTPEPHSQSWSSPWVSATPPPTYNFSTTYYPAYSYPYHLVSPLGSGTWASAPFTTPSPAHLAPLSPSRARKRPADENRPPDAFTDTPSSLPGPPKRKKRKSRTDSEKLSLIFDAIYEEAGWKLGEFLWHAFRYGENVTRTPEHVGRVEKFLKGNTSYTPAMILKLWLNHPNGHARHGGELYAMSPDYTELKPMRQAFTAFAAQTIRRRLILEAEAAVAPKNGLHTSRRVMRAVQKSSSSDAAPVVEKVKERVVWSDIGGATVSHVSNVIRTHQPVTWKLAQAIATRADSPDEGSVTRTRRPPELVIMQAISSLNFSRTNCANLLPTARALMYFALSAPYELFLHNSRLGSMIAYSTTLEMLKGLARHEAEVVRAHGKDPQTAGAIWLDNVQNYLVQRDQRIGRENEINIGIAATYVELPSCPCSAMDLEDKRRRLSENKRKDLTVDQLLKMINVKHRETVGTLQWLRVLTNYVPELSKYKEEVSMRYRTDGAKQCLDATPSRVHPLGTSGKNETISTELKDALLDFLEQIGQTPQEHNKQLLLLGGDGLTFEKIVQLKHYLQFHTNEIESLELVQPVLALWHTLWADLSRIFETHWGSLLTRDPSTLGHSAAKIGRRAPANLKKVDFHYGTELAYLVLDARMLDCWRLHFKQQDLFQYFASLASKKQLPTFAELEKSARKLFRAYSSHRAAERALYEADTSKSRPPGEWEETVPKGSPWVPPATSPAANKPAEAGVQSASDGHTPSTGSRQWASAESTDAASTETQRPAGATPREKPEFKGDRVLADSIAFMRDTWVLREFVYAVAEGDVGRVYEAMKMLLFTFAGSPHTKYTAYLLEFICSLELESSDELRRSILGTLLINLTGQPGRFSPADLIQEYFNRLLQAIAERKGVEYNDKFIREILSRNLHHLARLQDDLKESLGLKQRAGRHTTPHTDPELVTLLKEYREQELHSRRPGRQWSSTSSTQSGSKKPALAPVRDRDDYRRGLQNLRGGKLAKWVRESVFMHSAQGGRSAPDNTSGVSGQGSDSDVKDEPDSSPESLSLPSAAATFPGLPFARVVDGNLVIESVNPALDAHAITSRMASEDSNEFALDSVEPADESDDVGIAPLDEDIGEDL